MDVAPSAFEFAVNAIGDGFVFEEFAAAFVGSILGHTFVPAGGLKDRGIDGLEHTFHPDKVERRIYQASIEKDPEGKLRGSLQKLKDNTIEFSTFTYVTNQDVKDKDRLIDQLFDEFAIPVQIFDIRWMTARANHCVATQNAFRVFADSHLHEFKKPGSAYVVSDLVSDPRLFVFLRQQWEKEADTHDLTVTLTDTLILFALEDTDPDADKFKTEVEVKEVIASFVKFDPGKLTGLIQKRLKQLSSKPSRRIKFHSKAEGYCLPYETRVQIQERNLSDAALHEAFRGALVKKLNHYLKESSVRVRDAAVLVESAINQIYYQQGLEFADFVLKGENQDAFEKRLPDVVGDVVDSSSVVLKNKEQVKTCLLMTIRSMVYDGGPQVKQFLARLSQTYMMLFLLQFDPKLATFFHAMASKLEVYVGTSILVPALSEYYLIPANRRHWNLLKGAHKSGVTLIINETIVEELAHHFEHVCRKHEEVYSGNEDIYLSDEGNMLYVQEILIRAYFYAKSKDQVGSFDQFIDNFVTPGSRTAKDQLIAWLKYEFGIQFRSDASLPCQPDGEEVEKLHQELKSMKGDARSQNDARLVLTIHALRECKNEGGESGIFGYKTWWLSKDTYTQRKVNDVFGDKYQVSCYLRPDFLYNYIALAPSKAEIDNAYDELFPSLVGVNISFHLPHDVVQAVHGFIGEHKDKNAARVTSIIRDLGEELKTSGRSSSSKEVTHFLDEKLKQNRLA